MNENMMSIFERNKRGNNGFFRQGGAGGVVLSVQAGGAHYSSPRADLADLSDYAEVEVALFLSEEAKLKLDTAKTWLRPSDLLGYEGPTDEQVGFSAHDDVAGWVPARVARRLEEALHDWAARGGTLKLSR